MVVSADLLPVIYKSSTTSTLFRMLVTAWLTTDSWKENQNVLVSGLKCVDDTGRGKTKAVNGQTIKTG